MQRRFSVAVLLDVENLIKGYSVSTGVIRTVPLRGIIEEVRRRLPDEQIGVARAYANWSNSRLSVLREALNELGIQPVQVFGFGTYSTKNAADLQLAIDAVDLAHTRSALTTFVIVSGDGGFAALAGKMHELGRTVIGASYEHAASPVFQAVCDEFIMIATPEGLEPVSRDAAATESRDNDADEVELLPLPSIVPGLLEVPAYRNVTSGNGLALTGFHSYVTALLPEFQLPAYGFEKFLSFAAAVCDGTDLCVARDATQNVVVIRRDRITAGWQLIETTERQVSVTAEPLLSDEHLQDRQDLLATRWPVWPVPQSLPALLEWLHEHQDLQLTSAALHREVGFALAVPDDDLRRALVWAQASSLLQSSLVEPSVTVLCRVSTVAADSEAALALLQSWLTMHLRDALPGCQMQTAEQLLLQFLPPQLSHRNAEIVLDLEAGYQELGHDPTRSTGPFAGLQRLPSQLREAAKLAERVAQTFERSTNGGTALADWRQLSAVDYWQRVTSEPKEWQALAASYLETAEMIGLLLQYGVVMRCCNGSVLTARLDELGYQLLALTAESQSALRCMLERIVVGEEQRNPLQKAVFSWLKDYAREQRVHIQRYMKLSERADPAAGPSRLAQARLLALELYLRLHQELKLRQGFTRLATLVTTFDEDDETCWQAVEDQVELLVLLGTAVGDERLLNLLNVLREPLFAAVELPAAVEAVRSALALRAVA